MIVTEITERIGLADDDTEAWSVTSQADEGSNGTSRILIDDVAGDFLVPFLNNYRVYEDESEADDPYLFAGAFANASVVRDVYRTGVSRKWRTDVVDANVLLNNYLFREADDPERPQEDHSDRMTWLLGTSAMTNIDDTSLVDTSATVTMSETDYTGQTPADVLRDMIRQSGYDMFVYFFGVAEEYGLIYQPADADYLSSDIRISNIIADVAEDENTFYWSLDAELTIATERIASGVLARGNMIESFGSSGSTAATYGRRDVVMDEPNVKSQAVLDARVARHLAALSVPEYVPTGSIIVPRSKASQVRAGMRVQFRASHWSGFTEWTWGRILRATHTELPGNGGYEVRVELDVGESTPLSFPCESEYPPTPSGFYAPMHTDNISTAVLYYLSPGATFPEVPTPGYDGSWPFADYGAGDNPDFCGDCFDAFTRVMVVGAGTLTVDTATYGASRNLFATLSHRHIGDPDLTYDDEQTGVTGDSFVFNVSTHGGTECIHFVDVGDDGSLCGNKWGFAGATWVSSEA